MKKDIHPKFYPEAKARRAATAGQRTHARARWRPR